MLPGLPPAGTTKISSDEPDVGAGEHWYAQPMFHWPPEMVKLGLVQLPLDWYGPIRTLAVPEAGAVVVVAPPLAVAAAGAVVDVVADPDPDEVEEAGGGST